MGYGCLDTWDIECTDFLVFRILIYGKFLNPIGIGRIGFQLRWKGILSMIVALNTTECKLP